MNELDNSQTLSVLQRVSASIIYNKRGVHEYVSIDNGKIQSLLPVGNRKPKKASSFFDLTKYFENNIKKFNRIDKTKLLNCYKIIKKQFEDKELGLFSRILEFVFHWKKRQIEKANRIIQSVEKELSASIENPRKGELDGQSNVENVRDQIKQIIMQEESLTELPAIDIETHSLLNKNLPAFLSAKPLLNQLDQKRLLAHLHGDPFIGDTGLEGYNSSSVLKFLDHQLSEEPSLTPYRNSSFHQLIKTGKDIAEIIYGKRVIEEEEFSHLSHSDHKQKVKDLSNYLQEKIASQATFMLPGGWIGQPHGHAMYYEAIPQGPGLYTLRVYNTGSGINEYHPELHEEEKQKFYPFVEYQDIPAAHFIQNRFIQSLLEISTVKRDPLLVPPYTARDIYEVIIPQLGGRLVKPHTDRSKFILPQHSGICSVAGLMAVARNTALSTDSSFQDFALFQHQLKMNSLVIFYHHYREKLSIDEEARILFKKSTETFLREVLSSYQSGTIPKSRLLEAYATSQEILDAIEKAQITADRISLLAKKDVFIASEGKSIRPQYQTLPSVEITLPTSKSLITSIPYRASHWDFAANPLNAETINSVFDRFYTHCQVLYHAGQYKAVVHLTNQLFDTMPLPKQEGDFWSTLSIDQRRKCMEQICNMSDLLLRSSATYQTDMRRENEQQLSIYKGLAIQHKLAFLSGEFGSNFKNWKMPHGVISHRLERRKEDLNLYEKNKRDQFYSLEDYFKDIPKERSTPHDCAFFEGGPFALFYGGLIDRNDPSSSLERPEFTWAMERIKRQSTEAEVAASSEPLHIQAAFVLYGYSVSRTNLSDLDPQDVLPKEYDYLKKQASILQLLTLGKKEDIPSPEVSLTTPTFELLPYEKGRFYDIKSSKTIESVKFSSQYEYRDSVINITSDYPANLKHSQLAGLLDRSNRGLHIQGLVDHVREDKETFYQKYSSLFKDKEDCQEILLVLMREQLHVFSDPRGPFNYEYFGISKLISYFSKHIDKLSQLKFQEFFRYLFFKRNYIEMALENNPMLSKLLKDLISQGYRKFSEEGNVQAAIFFLHLKAVLTPFLERDHQGFDKREIRDNISALMDYPHCSPDEKALLHQLIIHSYSFSSPPLSEAEIQTILQSASFIGIHPIPESLKIIGLDEQVEKVLFRFSNQIYDFLAVKENGNRFLNSIVRMLRPDQPSYEEWILTSFPWCVSPDDQIAFNALEGIICTKGGKLAVLPSAIQENSHFIQIFGKDPYEVHYLGGGTYTFIDRKGVSTRIIDKGHLQGIAIQKELKPGKWYEWIPNHKDIPIPSEHLKESCFFWYSLPDKTKVTSHVPDEVLLTNIETEKLSYRLTVGSDKVIQSVERLNHSHESPLQLANIYRPSQEVKGQIISSLRPELEKLAQQTLRSLGSIIEVKFEDIHTLLLTQDFIAFKKSYIGLTDQQAEFLKTTLESCFNRHHSSYEFLSHIEDLQYVHVWEKRLSADTAVPAIIDLPRLGIQFNIVQEEGMLRAKAGSPLKDYYIASEQRMNGMGDFHDYLVLENKEGRKKVLIPRRKLHRENNSLVAKISLEKQAPKNVEKGASPFLIYDLDPERQIVATQPEQSLFLAYFRLGQKKYAKAMEFLRNFSRKMNPYSATEKELFSWIWKLQADTDPKRVSVSLCALACFLKNAKTFGKENDLKMEAKEWKKIIESYLHQYQPVSEHTTTLQLSKEEEMLLLKKFIQEAHRSNYIHFLSPLILRWRELDSDIQTDLLILPKAEEWQFTLTLDELVDAFTKEFANKDLHVLRRSSGLGGGFLSLYERAKNGEPTLIEELAFLKGDKNNYSLCLFLEIVWKHRTDPQFPEATVFKNRYSIERKNINTMLQHCKLKLQSIPLPASEETISRVLREHRIPKLLEAAPQPVEISTARRTMRQQKAIALMTKKHSLTKGKTLATAHLLSFVMNGNKKEFLQQYPQFSEKQAETIYQDFKSYLEKLESPPLVSQKTIQELFSSRSSIEGEEAFPLLSRSIVGEEYQELLEDAALDATKEKAFDYCLKCLSNPLDDRRRLHRLMFKYDQDLLVQARTINGSFSLPDLVTLVVHDNVKKFRETYPLISEQEAKDLRKTLLASLRRLETQFEKGITAKESSSVDLEDVSSPLSKLYTELSVQSASLRKDVLKNEFRILTLANQYSAEHTGVSQKLEELGTVRNRLQMNDLFVLFVQKDREAFKRRNPALTNAEIDKLNELILDYLVQNTQRQKIDRALKTLKEMEALGRVDAANINMQELTNRLHHELTITRAYDPSQKPEFLLFEYASDMTLRRDQVEKLNLMLSPSAGQNPNMILQSIMGSGKSKVFLPILALKNADVDRLSVVVVPESLYVSVAEDMLNQSRAIFKQATHVKIFDRNTEFTVQSLRDLLTDLKNIRSKKEYLLMTSKSLACLQLKIEETLHQYLQAKGTEAKAAELAQKIELAREIMAIFQQGKAILDEADTLLNCRHEVNFSIGDPAPLKQEYRDVSVRIFDLLNTNETLRREFPNGILSTSITKDIYETKVKPVILHQIMNDWSRFLPLSKQTEFKELLKNYFNNQFDETQKTQMKEILSGLPPKPPLLLIGEIRAPLDDVLAIIKGHLNDLLPVTLSKEYNTNFGFSHHSTKVLAVPYVANNTPNETSEFGNPYELLDYTLRMYHAEGIPFHLLKNHIERLQKDARAAIALDSSVILTETAAYKEFRELCKNPRVHFLTCTDKEIQDLATEISATRNLPIENNSLMSYVSKYVLPHIQIYPNKVSLNPHGLVEMFGQVQGFTGTPWNSATFHHKLETVVEKGTDGKTLNLLWKKCQGKVDTLKMKPLEKGQSSADLIVESLADMQKDNPHFRAIIDVGAMFKGINNLSVAKSLLRRFEIERPEIKGICFYEKNTCMVLERGKEHPVPFSESSLKPHERFTYYDQSHTVGADIKQATRAHAVVTIGKDLKWRDLAQALWRLREFDKGQQISLVYSPEEISIMRDILKTSSAETPLTLADIIKLVILNQNQQKQEHAVAGTIQKFHHELKKTVWKEICNLKYSIEDIRPLFEKAFPLFVKSTEDRPSISYGKKEERITKQEAMDNEIAQQLTSFKEIYPTLQALRNEKSDAAVLLRNEREFESCLKQAIGREAMQLMPDRIAAHLFTDIGSEVERETEKEQEQEMQKEIEMVSSQEPPPVKIARFWEWNDKQIITTPESIYSRDYYIATDFKSFKIDLDQLSLENMNKKLPLWSLHAIASSQKNLERFQDLFSDDLLASFNFLPLNFMNVGIGDLTSSLLFDSHQYPFFHRLIIKEKVRDGESRIRTIAISQDDAYFLTKRLAEKIPDDANVELYLCDKNLGIIQASSNGNVESLKSDPRFLEQQIVLDLCDGEMSFRPEKQVVLRKWIASKDARNVQHFFEEVVLKHKPDLRNRYEHSWLKKCLTELQAA